ncbi:uncharacterized protein MCYG_03640 [Microsporum canis CBS 113480]|uniref:Uncharacterized protein n=1 Tax=Arthroderma otae (strain ATCC MYA-4605 / CBS 113480) TaxID=554155 RepID=C5FJG0_ARTOC|nr:uncharacterized protein MCYG_03640 [Microsporum canis CBS 113480]EEQ30821.1 predicted protein [Microsporum canis CBS 113480]
MVLWFQRRYICEVYIRAFYPGQHQNIRKTRAHCLQANTQFSFNPCLPFWFLSFFCPGTSLILHGYEVVVHFMPSFPPDIVNICDHTRTSGLIMIAKSRVQSIKPRHQDRHHESS